MKIDDDAEFASCAHGRRGRARGLEGWLRHASDPQVAHSTATATLAAVGAAAFTVAYATYWLSDRDRLVETVVSLIPERRRDCF